MAVKGLEKLKRKLFGNTALSPEQKREEELKKQDTLDKNRLRELGFVQRLEQVKTSLLISNKLPKETVQEVKIDSVLESAIHHFSNNPVIVERDLSEIDASINYIICSLERAIEEGNKTTAHWASIALAAAINYLHVPVRDVDKEYTEALMKERVNYAESLENLIKNCVEHDYHENTMNSQLQRYDRENKALEEKLEELQTFLGTKKGKMLVIEIQKAANDQSHLSPEARKLQMDLYNASLAQKTLLGIAVDANIAAAHWQHYAAQIEQFRNILSHVPHVVDPALQAKNKQAHDDYLKSLRTQLASAEEGMRVINAYLVEMASLAEHSFFAQQTAVALDLVAQLELKKLREKENELEATKAMMRDKEHAALMRKIERELEAQVKALEELEEQEQVEEQTQENFAENQETEEVYEEEEELDYEDAD